MWLREIRRKWSLAFPLRNQIHPAVGYGMAIVAQAICTAFTLFLLHIFPDFKVNGLFMALGILCVALFWGTGPGLLASGVGAVLLNFFVLSPIFAWNLSTAEGITETCLFLIVGSIIGVVTSQREAARAAALQSHRQIEELLARLRTEQEISLQQAAQLAAVLEAVPDAIIAYACNGDLLFMNTAGQSIVGGKMDFEMLLRSLEKLNIRDEQGRPLPKKQWVIMRTLQGETLTPENAVEEIITLGNQERYISVTGTPLRSRESSIVGEVIVARDVTARRLLEQRTQNVLEALLTMAQAVVQGEEGTDEETQPPVHHSLRQLAELTCHALGCQHVSLTAVEPETEHLRPLALAGPSADLAQQWWNDQLQLAAHRLSESPVPSLIQRLRDNQVSLLDMTQPPFDTLSNPLGVREALVVPLFVRNRLVGFLALDYAGSHHHYTTEEIRLAEAVAKLAALVMERERLVSERTEARASELALREVNRRMSDFLSIVAHEIRTPLTSIKGNVQLAKRSLRRIMTQNVLPEETTARIKTMQEFLDRADRQTSVQNRLINDLVDTVRLHADRLELHLTRCDLVALVDEAIKNQRMATPTRTIRFEKTTPGEVFVLADPDRLEQVVSNYLSNALKYSEAHCPVDVRLQPAGSESVRVSVRDEGPGLSPDQQQLIWERFYRAAGIPVRSGSSVGLGLGLYICRMIIERQGGQVGVESRPGSGSTFWFTLPTEGSL